MTIQVTGATGFIGSNFVLDWLVQSDVPVINLDDDLTYAGNLENLASLNGDARHIFVKGSIGDFDFDLVAKLLAEYHSRAVVMNRTSTAAFMARKTSSRPVVGTFRLLEAVRAFHGQPEKAAKNKFRLRHV